MAASVDDEQVLAKYPKLSVHRLTFAQIESALQEQKQQAKLIFRRITPNAEPMCSIESGPYTLQ